MLLVVGTSACLRGVDLPDKSSQQYRDYISAFYVGLAALDVGDDVRAEERLKRATEIIPNEPAAWGNLGLLALRQREFDVSAERFEKARTLAPDTARVYALRGLLESSRGQYAEAIKNYRRAIELDPKDLRSIYALAQEVEREGGEQSEREVLGLYEKILAAQPSNLAVLLEVTRLAAKRGDAAKLKETIARVSEQASTWPPEAREQLNALRTAAEGANPRQAGSRVAFLRNVLLRVAEYRQGLLAVKLPADVLGDPFTRFVLLPSPDFTPAAPDEALTFAPEPLPNAEANKWLWVSYFSSNGEGKPLPILANGTEARVSERVTLGFPGGASSTPPAPDGITALDYNYDFKNDLVMAGAGGVRIYKQENAGAFTDVTGRTGLPAALTNARYTGVWPADIELDGDLDIVLGAEESAPVVLRNNGDETFKEARPFEGANNLRRFAWADVDEDGDPDAILVDASGRL
ncbi:MAG TPA: FG-GAP-like repeat-containing protein, partial [Pyrinomonadaceae bacterium]|nr:FG-GAP-like repeat-containing protein [Pyrinomonadaceae bacterium]